MNKGAYATGKQIAATKGMFSGFKEEYDKARGTNEEPDDRALVASEEPGSAAPAKPAPKKAAAKKPAPKKNMFSAFKEEYDKARHDD